MKIRVDVKLEKVVSVSYLVFFPIQVFLFFWLLSQPLWENGKNTKCWRRNGVRTVAAAAAAVAAVAVVAVDAALPSLLLLLPPLLLLLFLLISALFVGAQCQMPGVDFSLMKRGNWKAAATKRKSERTFPPSVRPSRPSVRFSSILFLYAAAQTAESVFFFCVPRLKMAAANNNNIWWKHNLKIFGLIKSLLNFLFNLDKTV